MATILFCTRLGKTKLYRSLCQATPMKLLCEGHVETDDAIVPLSEFERVSLPRPDGSAVVYYLFYSHVRVDFVKSDAPDTSFMRLKVSNSNLPPEQSTFHELMELISLRRKRPRKAQPSFARMMLAQMITLGALLDLSTFSILVQAHCIDLQLTYQHVEDIVFRQMKSLGLKPDGPFCDLLIDCVCARFGPELGYKLLKMLRSELGIQVPFYCYDVVADEFWDAEMMHEAAMVLIDMKQLEILPDDYDIIHLLKEHGDSEDKSLLKAVGI